MSKSKKPVAYIKPQDPSFLVKLKKEAGYVEGPTVDTKREVRGLDSGSDDEHDLQPVVVVLKSGDLTAEEAEKLTKEKESQEANAKADLSKRVVFSRPPKRETSTEETDPKKKKPRKEKDAKKSKQLLSFDDEEEN